MENTNYFNICARANFKRFVICIFCIVDINFINLEQQKRCPESKFDVQFDINSKNKKGNLSTSSL